MSTHAKAPFGVMVVNLGTPENPDAASVRRYLAQFLSDPRVIRVPRLLWWLILHGIILRIRPTKVAALYQSVWTDNGSPLMSISVQQKNALSKALEQQLGQAIPVELAMTYGEPSLKSAGLKLAKAGVERIIVLPLYPQYSSTTTAAVYDGLAAALKPCPDVPEIIFIRDYWQRPDYIAALKASVEEFWQEHGQPDKLLMSFHGIPQRYEDTGDPYPGCCRGTAKALASALGLSDDQWSESFQSRFGREEWVKPYTDFLLEEWGGNDKINRVDVICPAFSADCLETLEEIEEQNKILFLEAGGKEFRYIPCLNARPDHIAMMATMIQERARAWL